MGDEKDSRRHPLVTIATLSKIMASTGTTHHILYRKVILLKKVVEFLPHQCLQFLTVPGGVSAFVHFIVCFAVVLSFLAVITFSVS